MNMKMMTKKKWKKGKWDKVQKFMTMQNIVSPREKKEKLTEALFTQLTNLFLNFKLV